jgi:hypothetical protein
MLLPQYTCRVCWHKLFLERPSARLAFGSRSGIVHSSDAAGFTENNRALHQRPALFSKLAQHISIVLPGSKIANHIGGVMVGVLASSAVARGLRVSVKPKTKIGIC